MDRLVSSFPERVRSCRITGFDIHPWGGIARRHLSCGRGLEAGELLDSLIREHAIEVSGVHNVGLNGLGTDILL